MQSSKSVSGQVLAELSYDTLSPDHSKRLANAYAEIAVIYKEAGLGTLEKVAALQSAWFRNRVPQEIAPL